MVDVDISGVKNINVKNINYCTLIEIEHNFGDVTRISLEKENAEFLAEKLNEKFKGENNEKL